MHVCKTADKEVFAFVSGYIVLVSVCVDLLSRVSRQDGYRGEVGAIERGKRTTFRTSGTPRLPSHTKLNYLGGCGCQAARV